MLMIATSTAVVGTGPQASVGPIGEPAPGDPERPPGADHVSGPLRVPVAPPQFGTSVVLTHPDQDCGVEVFGLHWTCLSSVASWIKMWREPRFPPRARSRVDLAA